VVRTTSCRFLLCLDPPPSRLNPEREQQKVVVFLHERKLGAGHILKMTERQVYELTRRRSAERMEHPFPAFNIHAKAKRVRRSDLMAWKETLAKQGR
jgi:hypothetical protein